MKLFRLICCMCVCLGGGQLFLCAQNSLTIEGFVLDALGNPVVGQRVRIEAYSTNTVFSYSDTATTNLQGYYVRQVFPPFNAQGVAISSITDCSFNGGQQLVDSTSYSPSDTLVSLNFTYCLGGCQSLFSASDTGLAVGFQDRSTSFYPITSWEWNFGDGDSAFSQNPQHVYTLPGIYTVCLKIWDASLCSNTFCDTLVVGACEADFSWVQNKAFEVAFQAVPANSPNPSYLWDFGDGSSGSGLLLNHTYTSAGTYRVLLTVRDSLNNCFDTLAQVINVKGDQECLADFEPIFLSNDSIRFQNQSIHSFPGQSNILNQWTFGDGNSSTAGSPTHVYSSPGNYLVCLLIEDDFGCKDTFCQTLTITPGPLCDPSFVYNTINNLTVAFSALDINPRNTYRWEIEGGSTLFSEAFFYTFPRPGTYEVCLTVSDTSGACADSLCQNITLLPTELCVADFSWNALNPNTLAFYSLSSSADPSRTDISWDFGDGTGSNELNPVHTYSLPGPWEVCQVVFDRSINCFQQICYTVTADTAPTFLEIKGWVYEGSFPSFDANVLLYQHSVSEARMDRIFQDPASFRAYVFDSLKAGSFLLYADHVGNEGYIPTYLGDVLHWQEATSTVLNQGNVVNPPINMIEGVDIQGNASIRGKIFEGLGASDGPPLADQVVLLLLDDLERTPVKYIRTDVGGSFRLDNLPLGTYWVYPEIPGVYTAPLKVEIRNTIQIKEGVDFGVGEQFAFPVSMEEQQMPGISLYPNPAHDKVRILSEEDRGDFRILNSLGQHIWQGSLHTRSMEEIPTASWPAGLYLFEWKGTITTYKQTFLITHP